MSTFLFGFGVGSSIVLYARAVTKRPLLFRPYEHLLAGGLVGYLMHRNATWNNEQREKLVAQLESLQKSSFVIRRRLGMEGGEQTFPEPSDDVEHRPEVEKIKAAFAQGQSSN